MKENKTSSGATKNKTRLKSPQKAKKPPNDDAVIAAEIKEELAKAKELREQTVTIGKEEEIVEVAEEDDENKSSEFDESDPEIVETASGKKVKKHRRDSP